MSKTAFVSGANGYLALHLVKLLIANDYKVIGSVRSEAKGQDIKARFPTNFEYEIVPELVAPGAFDAALQKHPDVSVFFHTASPLKFGLGDVTENLLNPAIEGVKNALKAAETHGKNITRFVLTSSSGAVNYNPDPNAIINEESWSNITWEEAVVGEYPAYIGSKTFGEQAAWEYVKTEKPHYEFVSVNPTYIYGPQAFDPEKGAELNASVGVLTSFLTMKPTDPFPFYQGLFYDVRDVAQAHLVAAESKDAAGARLILQAGPWNAQLVANTIRERYPHLKETVPVGKPETLEADLHEIYKNIDTSKSDKILGIKPISWEKMIFDTYDQIFASEK